jgi:hypothetical protein
MKNQSSTSRGLRAAPVHRAFGLDDHSSRRRPRSHTHHPVRVGEREARNLTRNGRAPVQGLRRQCLNLAYPASPLRPRPSSRRPHQAQTPAICVASAADGSCQTVAPNHEGVEDLFIRLYQGSKQSPLLKPCHPEAAELLACERFPTKDLCTRGRTDGWNAQVLCSSHNLAKGGR